MFNKIEDIHLRTSVVALIISNCVTLIGVLFFNWSVFMVLLLYWMETIIIGFYNIFKMFFASKKLYINKSRNYSAYILSKLYAIAFFIVHYGFFFFIYCVFFFSFFYDPSEALIVKWGALAPLINGISASIGTIKIALIALFLSHGVSFFTNYIGKKEYKKYDENYFFWHPYGRIVIMHLVILFGAFLIYYLGSTKWLVVLLVLLKIFIDFKAHVKEHTVFKSEIKKKK